MRRRQKIILGITLCLSIVMIFTAIIRISAVRIGKEGTDLVWEWFWEVVENCLAVAMASISAFRFVFVGKDAQLKPPRNKPWYVHRKNLRNTRNRRNWMDIESEGTEKLPEIPRATMTGMRTFIRGHTRPGKSIMRCGTLDESSDQSTLHSEGNQTTIRVDYSISQTDEV